MFGGLSAVVLEGKLEVNRLQLLLSKKSPSFGEGGPTDVQPTDVILFVGFAFSGDEMHLVCPLRFPDNVTL